jgi:hypothetical protein
MKTFLEFSGWIELDKNAMMDYIGVDENKPKRITVKEWQQLPTIEREKYVTSEGLDVLYRDSTNCDFSSWDLIVESEYD